LFASPATVHADTNNDGMITAADILAVMRAIGVEAN